MEKHLRDLWDYNKKTNICLIRDSEEKRKRVDLKNHSKE